MSQYSCNRSLLYLLILVMLSNMTQDRFTYTFLENVIKRAETEQEKQ